MKDRTISFNEAIMQIRKKEREPRYRHMGEDWQVGLIMAEHILYDLPPFTPCENAISREEVLLMIDSFKDNYGSLIDLAREVRKMPPVNPQPKTGHWITKIKSDKRGDMWPTNPKCSECGGEPYYSYTIYNYKFCPYCGAKMIEPQEVSDKG